MFSSSKISAPREVVLDTETTGLDPRQGHRIIEIGCIELVNHVPTGRVFHKYLNPERDVEAEAVAVHGLTAEKLSAAPRFAEIAGDLLDFIDGAQLVIHNAEFDVGFLNAEFEPLGFAPIPIERATCTVKLARRRFPGAPANLDALCRRFNVDNSGRTFHGALLDAQLLAECYVELLGGRQPGLALAVDSTIGIGVISTGAIMRREPRPHAPSAEELAAHLAMLGELKSPLWLAEA
jgi:DNA polymerase-3 subunit epsilon